MFTYPMRKNVEIRENHEVRNIFVYIATLRSMSPVSFANLLIIRPTGFEWKNDIGALSMAPNMPLCRNCAAARLDNTSQNEFAKVRQT